MKIYNVILFCYLLSNFGLGQDDSRIKIKFNLLDSQTSNEVSQAKITIESNDSKRFKTTYQNGDTLDLPFDQKLNWQLAAKASGYKVLRKEIDLSRFKRKVARNKVVEVDLLFDFDGQYTDAVDINATYKPSIKFKSDTLSVSDYVLIDEDHQILLTYPQRLNKSSELIWFEKGEIEGRLDIQGVAKELITDFQGNVYLRCEKADFLISKDQTLMPIRTNTKELDNYILPILDSLEENRLYFSNYNPYYPAYDYFMVEKSDTTYTKIRHIEDDLMMEQYRAEYKWADVRTKLWAWDMEAETGIDREVWVGANVFTNSIYYEPPIGDFYRDGQDLYVFDFYNDLMITYDAYTGKSIDSVAINFHHKNRKTGWEEKVIQDPVTKKMYTFFDDAGTMEIASVDSKTGEIDSKFRLHYRYVENIQIYDGMIYYIYRPYESPQKKYLYFEDLQREESRVSIDH